MKNNYDIIHTVLQQKTIKTHIQTKEVKVFSKSKVINKKVGSIWCDDALRTL